MAARVTLPLSYFSGYHLILKQLIMSDSVPYQINKLTYWDWASSNFTAAPHSIKVWSQVIEHVQTIFFHFPAISILLVLFYAWFVDSAVIRPHAIYS